MSDCYDGCKDCDNPVCTSPAGKDVLVLSTYLSKNVPMIISFDGEYREASFEFGSQTEVKWSCSAEFKGEYYVFGGESKNSTTQVRGNIKRFL